MKSHLFPLLLAFSILISSMAYAIPNKVNVSGSVYGEPFPTIINGEFGIRVIFYPTESSEDVLYTESGLVEINYSSFSFPVTLSGALLSLEEIWYSVEIDLNSNGFDQDDLFPNRFQVTAVPYTLATTPTNYFLTGAVADRTNTVNAGIDSVFLVSFSTPPGGVEFDRMSIQVAAGSEAGPGNSVVSYGIYTAEGELVISSGPILIPRGSLETFPINVTSFPEKKRLEPNTRYYAAFASDSGFVSVRRMYNDPVPFGWGRIPNGATGGVIPQTIDENQIVQDGINGPPVPAIALYVAP